MVTLPIDLVLNVTVGASVALASRGTVCDYRLLRSPALWSLLVLQFVVFVPVAAYLLWRFPAWSLMYLVEATELPFDPAYLTLVYPVIALGTFLACRRLLVGYRVIPVLALILASLGLAGTIGFLGREQLLVVGTTAAFRSNPDTMRLLVGSTLAWVAAAGMAAVLIVWIATLWRLAVLVRVMGLATDQAEPEEGAADNEAEATPKKRRGTQKKA